MPVAFQWTASLATGVPDVDDQHKEIFRRANVLFEACVRGKSAEEVRPLLEYLQSYIREHFTAEEAQHDAARYPGRVSHRVLHRTMAAHLAELTLVLEEAGAGANLVRLTNRLVVGWLVNHIMREDRAFAEYLRSRPTP
ncbi:MAG: hemerythrin family protein [Deltaproteobacteria bacterium]|nr:hemerythrin family protein [Deltaproteobacteria bacterium]